MAYCLCLILLHLYLIWSELWHLLSKSNACTTNNCFRQILQLVMLIRSFSAATFRRLFRRNARNPSSRSTAHEQYAEYNYFCFVHLIVTKLDFSPALTFYRLTFYSITCLFTYLQYASTSYIIFESQRDLLYCTTEENNALPQIYKG